jgi:predicted transposase/invertase (TIGR01784 family)
MEQLPTPHNNFFHFALSYLPIARNLLETQLSRAALAELNLESLQVEAGSYIDSDLKEKFSDLLMSVSLANSPPGSAKQALVYLLFEHKSQSDRLTAFQLLSYIVRIWEKRLREGLDLCPIIPLVVYHGERPWSAARSLQELLNAPSALAEYQVDFRFPLLDLGELPDSGIAGEPILQSTLRLLKYSRSRQLVGMLGELLLRIAQALPESQLPQWIKAIGVYVMSVNKNIDAQEYKQTLKSILPVQFEPGSLADRLLIQGREEGRQEGRQEGREEGEQIGLKKGKLAGKIQMLQDLLGDTPTTDAEFQICDIDTLTTRLADLQQRLRARQV